MSHSTDHRNSSTSAEAIARVFGRAAIDVMDLLHPDIASLVSPAMVGAHVKAKNEAPAALQSGATEGTVFPAICLYYVREWSVALGGESYCYLQGYEDTLYLRVQNSHWTENTELEIQSLGEKGQMLARSPLSPAVGAFALRSLNGGGMYGSLWLVEDFDVQDLLSDEPATLRLVEGPSGARRALGVHRYRPVKESGDSRIKLFSALAAAYSALEPEDFAEALKKFCTRRVSEGGIIEEIVGEPVPGGVATPPKSKLKLRFLSLMERLWASALVAEVRKALGPDSADFGCLDLEPYPMLDRNEAA